MVKSPSQVKNHEIDHKKAIRELSRSDKKMASLIERVGPFRLEVNRGHTPFHALARSIIYQQLNGTAARTIHGRLVALFNKGERFTPDDILAATDERLRSAGVSGSKILALRDLSAKTLEGLVPTARGVQKFSDDELIEKLVEIRGIGRWTVEMLLIFHLGRPDVLPVTDYGIRNGFAITYKRKELPDPKELVVFGEKWKPFRTVASWYLWRAVDLAKDAKKS